MNARSLNRAPIPKWLKFIAIAIIAIGVLFRFTNIDKKVYWHDEVINSFRASGYTLVEADNQLLRRQEIKIQDLQAYQYPNRDKTVIDTIKGLANDEPQNPPLYYIITYYCLQLFGHSVTITRSVSAVVSLLIFPAIYWCCQELFKQPIVGWVAMMLVSVSPFHLLYAQEARPYSLWTVTILLSSAAFLRSIRINTNSSWTIYGTTLILSFYTFPFSLLVAVAHGIYLIFIQGWRFNRTIISYIVSTITSLIVFAPWLFFLAINSHKINPWRDRKVSILALVASWAGNLSRNFIDFNFDANSPSIYIIPSTLVALLIIGYSIYSICRKTTKSTWLFILTSIAVMAADLILPDLILGGQRSRISRYLIPCYLGINLTVAYCLTTNIFAVKRWRRFFWKLVAIGLIALEIASCASVLKSATWWNKSLSVGNLDIAAIVNQSDRPLLIGDDLPLKHDKAFFQLISLSYLLEPKVRIQLGLNPEERSSLKKFSDVFIFYPSDELKQQIQQDNNYHLKLLSDSEEKVFWRLDVE